MLRYSRPWLPCFVLLFALSLWAGSAGARRPAPYEPIVGPTSWTDLLDDSSGLSWLEGTQQVDGQVNLNPMQPLSAAVSSIVSLTEGPNGVFYMGTAGARLWSYDLLTGLTSDLGAPVPEECDN